jgi:hypothetical protein
MAAATCDKAFAFAIHLSPMSNHHFVFTEIFANIAPV